MGEVSEFKACFLPERGWLWAGRVLLCVVQLLPLCESFRLELSLVMSLSMPQVLNEKSLKQCWKEKLCSTDEGWWVPLEPVRNQYLFPQAKVSVLLHAPAELVTM